MKKFIIFSLLYLLLPVTIATAQNPNDSIANEEQAYNKAFDELMDASGTRVSLRAQFPQLMQMVRNICQDVPEGIMQKLENGMRDIFFNKINELYVPIYKRYFTLQEIRELTEFYNTPIGKKLAMSLPTLNGDLLKAGQEAGKEVAIKILEKLKAEGYTPKEM